MLAHESRFSLLSENWGRNNALRMELDELRAKLSERNEDRKDILEHMRVVSIALGIRCGSFTVMFASSVI